MAGLGFKDFQVGEVLTSSDVDGYLMQQTVMRFADSGARGSALGTAAGTGVPLAEGMMSYLNDVDDVQVYTGSSWASVVSIRQVVSTTKTDTFSTTSATLTDITGLSVTITPASSSNKVLLILTLGAVDADATSTIAGTVERGGTSVGAGTPAGNRIGAAWFTITELNRPDTVSWTYLDSPATTSATTYQARIQGQTGNTVYVNRSDADNDLVRYARTSSTITAIEVAA